MSTRSVVVALSGALLVAWGLLGGKDTLPNVQRASLAVFSGDIDLWFFGGLLLSLAMLGASVCAVAQALSGKSRVALLLVALSALDAWAAYASIDQMRALLADASLVICGLGMITLPVARSLGGRSGVFGVAGVTVLAGMLAGTFGADALVGGFLLLLLGAAFAGPTLLFAAKNPETAVGEDLSSIKKAA